MAGLALLLLVATAAAAALAPAALAAPSYAQDVQLPDFIEVCNRDDPRLNSCLLEKLRKVLPKLSEGLPEVGLQTLDPFVVPEMLVEYRQGDVAGKMLVRNTRCYGISGIQVLDVRANLNDSNKFHLEVDIHYTTAFIEGDYKAQGKIVVFPIEGKGVYNISMQGISATWNLTGEHIKKRGKDYVRINRFTMFPEIEEMKFYASNLFTGNEDFNKAALQFANDFWPVLYTEMLPFVNEGWDKVMRGVANKVFSKVPFDQLFPSSAD